MVVLFAGGDRSLLGVARVVEALAIGQPGYRGEAASLDPVGPILFLVDVAHVERALFVAVLREPEDEQLAVVGRRPPVERGRPILRQRVGIDQNLVGAFDAVAHVENGLVLVSFAFGVKVAKVTRRHLANRRRADGADAHQLAQAIVKEIATSDPPQHTARERVLFIGPALDLVAVSVLEPPIRVGHRLAEQLIDDRLAPRRHGQRTCSVG